MLWKYSDGWQNEDFSASLSIEDDYTLTDNEKKLFVAFTCSAASKSLVLGLDPGDTMIVTNVGGTNAVTVKAVSGDTGTSVAAGKVALVIGIAGANNSKVLVLN